MAEKDEPPDSSHDARFDGVLEEAIDVDVAPLVSGGGDHRSTVARVEMAEHRLRKQRSFLRAFADSGTVQSACSLVNVNRRTVYHWIDDDPAFEKAFDAARAASTDALEAECRRRAKDGVADPEYYQGQVVGYRQKYSDLCLLALLNAYRPEKFKQRHEHTGKDGGPMAVVHVSYDANMKPDDM